MRIGIAGVGILGNALAKVFDNPVLYDPPKKIGSIDELNTAEVVFICVPTPYKDGFDLSAVEDVVSSLEPRVIVIKSTVLPGSTDYLQQKYQHHRILFNPEFLTTARADIDMARPDTQIIGYTDKSYSIATDILAILPKAPFERIMPAKEAEMIKYFRNSWFATKVVFANQFYDLCQKMGIDYEIVKEGAAADRRMTGTSHLEIWHKGYRGVGGACLPKDVKSLVKWAEDKSEMKLLKKVLEINDKLTNDKGDI